jgi:ferredoxin--NADP+ reductase
MSQLKAYQIIENIQISPNAYILSVKRDFEFKAGQVIGLTCNKQISPRLYSICSSINDLQIKILYSIKADGELTPMLCRLIPGDTVYLTKVSGNFSSTNNEAVWIASGTGVAPFVSMILSGNKNNKKLIHGSRTSESFYFSELFSEILGKQYIRCCSGEKLDNTYFGRLTKYIKETNDLPQSQMYYICGSAEMVVETRDILISRGILFNNIASEIYF